MIKITRNREAGYFQDSVSTIGLGARIVKASTNEFIACGVGDAILLNLSMALFAVADSPDSNPSASREFLQAFNHTMERIAWLNPEFWRQGCEVGRLKEYIAEAVNQLIVRVSYRCSTTFSCIMCVPAGENFVALMYHSGDSCIYKIDLEENSVQQVSWSSINHIGRVQSLSQVGSLDVNHSTRFVLCTDGLHALVRNVSGRTLPDLLLETLKHSEAHQAPGQLMAQYGHGVELPDDIAIIVLDPCRILRMGETILMGGEELGNYLTTP